MLKEHKGKISISYKFATTCQRCIAVVGRYQRASTLIGLRDWRANASRLMKSMPPSLRSALF
jgi:hypothetical protein